MFPKIKQGIGSFGLMGDSWGFDGSQHYPSSMNPWCKIIMGWISSTLIEKSGRYTLKPSVNNAQVFQIKKGFPKNEYLLIENRQAVGFDAKLPKSGLIIYHIDELASFSKNPGWPGQKGWPQNGNHYRVAILQPDGLFSLEQGADLGDAGDIWQSGLELDKGGSSADGGPYPNTDSYQSGRIKQTGIRIYDIRNNGENIDFSIEFPGSRPPPPTKNEPSSKADSELVTTYIGGNGA